MGLIDKIRGEFIDIIEWLDDSRDTFVWRFPRHDNEIKMGAQLVVRESQTAVFVNEGALADVFTAGTYTLETENMPILSTLKGWKYGFHSPFKAEVYFVTTRLFTNMKWGTQNPVIVRDPDYGPVRLRAFGAYAARVSDARKLVTELSGTDAQFRTEEIQEYLRQTLVARLGAVLGGAGISVVDLAAHQGELGSRVAAGLSEEFAPIGIEISNFVIENISLPPEVEAALDKRSEMALVGDLDAYTKFQSANAVQDAAHNPGAAGEGVGLGIGVALGQRMAGSLASAASSAPQAPPPLPAQAQWFIAVNGARQGPFDTAALAQQVASGALTASTLVWHPGMAQWSTATEVAEVASLFDAVPPPLPPTQS